jgi:Glycosyltransferases involved in cell wall biogenesis
MNMNPLISIIVPVYKVEEYLDECIQSILKQSYKNLEIILIDDGSPDRCPQLCDEYSNQDKRIRVIHKENGGLSDARNTGILASHGEYLLFIDSDDFWTSHQMVETLIQKLNEYPYSDIIFFGSTTIAGDKHYPSPTIDHTNIDGKSKIEGLEFLLRNGDIIPSCCKKMIRRDLLIRNNIFFKKGLLSEDWDWTIYLYIHAKTISAVNQNFYGYRKRKGSITSRIGIKHFNDILYIITKWNKDLKTIDISNKEKEIYFGFLAHIYSMTLALLYLADKSVKSEIQDKLKPMASILGYNINPKVKKTNLLYHVIGFNLTCKILQFYLKNRSKHKKT